MIAALPARPIPYSYWVIPGRFLAGQYPGSLDPAEARWKVQQFLVGGNTIGQDSCNSTVTYMNNTRQVPTTSSPFQEVLLQDNASQYLIYMASIDYQTQGYDNSSYDFQMIVAESDVKASPTPYYFYVELR